MDKNCDKAQLPFWATSLFLVCVPTKGKAETAQSWSPKVTHYHGHLMGHALPSHDLTGESMSGRQLVNDLKG